MRLSPETIVVALGIFLALWYLGASMFNRRRGVAVFRWLHDGLDALGGEISSRWIGSSGSGAQIRVAKADPPLKDLDVIYLLASRELLPLFLFDLARGKRDRLIVKAGTRAASPAELEAVPAKSRLGRQMQAEVDHPWQIEKGPGWPARRHTRRRR